MYNNYCIKCGSLLTLTGQPDFCLRCGDLRFKIATQLQLNNDQSMKDVNINISLKDDE